MSNFTVSFSNPSKIAITVADNSVNTSTSLKLIGKYVTNYSQPIAENFIKLLENFSNVSAPVNPVEGQLWYDTRAATAKHLKIYDGSYWVPTNNIHKVQGILNSLPAIPAFAQTGDILVSTLTNQLWIYDGSTAILVGPSTATTALRNGVYVESLADVGGANFSVVNTYVDGDIISIYSKSKFIPNPVISGFNEIKPGLNVTTRSFSGEDSYIEGNSQVALALKLSNLNFPVSADNFLRNDESGKINGQLAINNNGGIKIGFGNQTVFLENVGNTALLSNRFADGDIGLSVFHNNVLNQVVTVDGATLRVGINDVSPSATLHVNGTGIFTDKITVGTAVTTGTMIEPVLSNTVDIGSVGKSFRTVYAENFSFTSTTTNYSHVATGGIIIHADLTPPPGWLECNGGTIDPNTNPEYTKLYTLIGSTLPTLASPGPNLIYIIKY